MPHARKARKQNTSVHTCLQLTHVVKSDSDVLVPGLREDPFNDGVASDINRAILSLYVPGVDQVGSVQFTWNKTSKEWELWIKRKYFNIFRVESPWSALQVLQF